MFARDAENALKIPSTDSSPARKILSSSGITNSLFISRKSSIHRQQALLCFRRNPRQKINLWGYCLGSIAICRCFLYGCKSTLEFKTTWKMNSRSCSSGLMNINIGTTEPWRWHFQKERSVVETSMSIWLIGDLVRLVNCRIPFISNVCFPLVVDNPG